MNNLIHFSDPRIEYRVVYLFDYPLDVRAGLIPDHISVGCLFPPSERKRGPVRAALRLRRVVREWQPDLIHSSLAQASLASRIAGWMTRVPVIQTLVNVAYEPERLVDNPNVSRWKLEILRLIDKITMRRVRLFHAVSEAVADSWVRTVRIPREKIRVIPRGVDCADLDTAAARGPERPELLDSLDLPPRVFLMLAVGRQEPQKGHRYLLEALHLLGDLEPPAVLLIAGRSGCLTGTLQAKVEDLGLAGRVRFLGHRDDVPSLLRAADLFVFPSLHEGMPGSLLEAMCLGCACVAADIGPVHEVMTDSVEGLIVPPRDPSALASAITELARDTHRRERLGAAARARVLAAFSATVAAQRLESMYWEALRTTESERRLERGGS